MIKKYSFAVDKVENINFEEYDEDFAIVRLGFLSDRANSHKLDISKEVLKDNASTALGKFVIGKIFLGDTMGHETQESIFGYVPKEQEVIFEEEDGEYTRAYVNAVVSKIYAEDFYNILERDKEKSVSVEMSVTTPEDDETDVLAFNIHGITVLGQTINPSCPKSTIKMVRFSEEEAHNFYEKVNHSSEYQLYQLAEKRRKAFMAEKTYKVDKSKKAVSDKPWGDVDKTELRNKIMDASNKASLVKDVYMVVETGWEDAPSEKLKYPVMCFEGDTLVYNKGGLSSALGYAKAEGEDAVVSKVESIRKKLDLDDGKGKEGDKKMAEEKDEKMAEIEGRKAWGAVIRKVQDHEGKGVYVDSIEDNHIIYTKGDVRYRVEADVKVDPDDKSVDAKIDWGSVKKDKDQKMAQEKPDEHEKKLEEEHDDEHEDDDDDDDNKGEHKEEMSFEDAKVEMARLKTQLEEKENIIMGKDAELEDLRNFKKTVMEKEKVAFVDAVLEEAKEFVDKTQMEELRKEGLACKFEEKDGWANKDKAIGFETARKNKENKKETFWSFSAPVEPKTNQTGSIWDKL